MKPVAARRPDTQMTDSAAAEASKLLLDLAHGKYDAELAAADSALSKIGAVTPKASIRGYSSLPIGLALALMLPPLLASAESQGFGVTSTCTGLTPPRPSQRFQCNFSAFPQSVKIQYVSMQCGSTGSAAFALDEFQVLTTPPGSTSEVAYQIPITIQASLAGGVNTGSPVTLYQKGRQGFRALIDLAPSAPPSGTTQCTVSVSGAQAD